MPCGVRLEWDPDPVTNVDELRVPEGGPQRLRLYTAQRLLRWTVERAQGWPVDRHPRGHELILLSIFARSTRTYEAVVKHLGDHSFGEQGLMLNRSLFEDMIDAHWVSLNAADAVARLADHDLYSRLLRADAQRKHRERWFDGRKPPAIKISNEERKRLRDLYGKKGSRSWTGIGDPEELLESVLVCWNSDDDRHQVRWWADWVQKIHNETLHPSAWSIGRLGAPVLNDSGNLEWRFGATPEYLTMALTGAWWTYSQTVGLIVKHFGLAPQGQAQELFDSATQAFETASRWERTGSLAADDSEAAAVA